MASRNNLANAYQAAGRVAEAIPLHERILADRERLLGSDHPDTLAARNNVLVLVLAQQKTGQTMDTPRRRRWWGPRHRSSP